MQEFDGISNAAPDDSPKSLIYGDPLIYEEILGTKYVMLYDKQNE